MTEKSLKQASVLIAKYEGKILTEKIFSDDFESRDESQGFYFSLPTIYNENKDPLEGAVTLVRSIVMLDSLRMRAIFNMKYFGNYFHDGILYHYYEIEFDVLPDNFRIEGSIPYNMEWVSLHQIIAYSHRSENTDGYHFLLRGERKYSVSKVLTPQGLIVNYVHAKGAKFDQVDQLMHLSEQDLFIDVNRLTVAPHLVRVLSYIDEHYSDLHMISYRIKKGVRHFITGAKVEELALEVGLAMVVHDRVDYIFF